MSAIGNINESCLSYLNIKEHYFDWTIENLEIHLDKVQELQSQLFPVEDININFQFSVIEHQSKGPFRVEIGMHTRTESQKINFIKIHMEDSHFKDGLNFEYIKRDELIKIERHCDVWSVWTSVWTTRGRIKQNLYTKIGYINCSNFENCNDMIILKFKISFCETLTGKLNPTFNLNNVPYANNYFNLKYLLNDNVLTDFTFIVSDKEIKAHKCILAAQSEVFLKMFQQNMTEKSENIAIIKDIKPIIFNDFIRYIYGEKINISDESVPDFLFAANKYDIKNLKILCEKKLHDNISTENAYAMYQLACLYDLEKLKDKALFLNAKKLQQDTLKKKDDLNEFDKLSIVKYFMSTKK